MFVRLFLIFIAAAAPVLTDYVTEEVDCGIVTARDGQATNSRLAQPGDLPWHAAVYMKTHTPYTFGCGATLIKSDVVLSVAHCFWDNAKHQLKSPSEYAVAVGKLYRAWDDPRDVDAQKSDVKAIRLPLRFHGLEANYDSDISVVTVSHAFDFTGYIRPVCLNFDLNLENTQLQTGNLGKVAGWQKITKNGDADHVLKVMRISYVNVNECLAETPKNAEFITSDKICARYGNGSNVCIGESGVGLAFPQHHQGTEKYYLRGVVSIILSFHEDICNAPTALVGLTRVTKHQSFLMQNL